MAGGQGVVCKVQASGSVPSLTILPSEDVLNVYFQHGKTYGLVPFRTDRIQRNKGILRLARLDTFYGGDTEGM